MKINDELTKKIAKLASEIMYSAEKEGEARSQGEADFVNQHVDNIEVVDNRDEKLGKVEEPKEKKDEKKLKTESHCEDDMEETKMSDEEIEEALSKSTPASEWIKDFVHSKNPMFKGKSKDERIKMALGAYYAKKNESLDEMKTTDDISMFGITIPKGTEVIAGENAAHFIRYDKSKFKFDKQLASTRGYKEPKDGTLLAINRDNKSIAEAAGKLNSYVVFKDSAKKDHKIYGEFIGNEENNTAVISISGKGYTLPKQDVHQSASGMNESVKLNEATEKISSDIWISELGNVLARAETKDLAMAFEAWANSYYKTPVWQSLVNNPLLKNLFDTMAESLDIFIGTSNEERDAKMDDTEEMEESMPNSSYMNMADDKLADILADKSSGNMMARMQAKRVLDIRAKGGKSTYGTDPVRSALNRKKGMMESSKYVINIEGKIYSEKGKAVEFDDKEKAEKAVAKIKGHSSMTGKEVKVDNLNEESETEIAAIEKEYLAAKDKKAVLKKYDITSGISRLRPGEIKLGIRNELNGRTSFAALDTDGKLIIISGTEKAPKIRYVKDVMKKEEETSASAIALPDVRLFGKEKDMTEAAKPVPTDPEDFMNYFDNKYNSAAGMWLAKKRIPALMKLVNDKSKTIKTAAGDGDKEGEYEKIIKKMKEKGFRLFDSEDNESSLDFIFYK